MHQLFYHFFSYEVAVNLFPPPIFHMRMEVIQDSYFESKILKLYEQKTPNDAN